MQCMGDSLSPHENFGANFGTQKVCPPHCVLVMTEVFFPLLFISDKGFVEDNCIFSSTVNELAKHQ